MRLRRLLTGQDRPTCRPLSTEADPLISAGPGVGLPRGRARFAKPADFSLPFDGRLVEASPPSFRNASQLLRQVPVLFTTRASALLPMVKDLTDSLSRQRAATTGHAEDKEREEQELETAAHEISEALADWFEDQNREANAAQVSLSLTGW